MYKMYEMELAGRTLRVDVDRVAKQANGAVLMHYGDTTVLCTSTASEKPRDGIDFFPLSVEYNERLYAVGKIPGGFNKREGKASENAILTDRVIDRPMRPLFPKDYRNDVTLENLVMSVDQDCSPELTAMLGAALATSISDIPFDGPISTTQVGLVDGEFVFNPTAAQKEVSELALTVASTKEKVIMIEAGAKEVPEAKMIEAIFAAHDLNQEVIAFFETIVAECGKPKHEYQSFAVPQELFDAIQEIVPAAEMEEAVFTDDKQTREANIKEITEKLEKVFTIEIPKDEIGYITMHLKGARLRLNKVENDIDLDNLDIKQISNYIITEVENDFNIEIINKQKLSKDIYNHLVPAISRMSMKLNIRNPLLENIKEQYSEIYHSCENACEILKKITKIDKIPESEVAYIAMHIAAAIEENLKNEILNLYFYIGDNIEEGHFKESLNEIMALCKKGNKYFDNNKVWDLLSLNPSKCKDVIYNCIQIIVNLSNLLYPFMPNTCKKIKQSLDLKDGIWSFTEKKEGIIRECDILFTKIDKKRASEEVARLKENKI